MSWQSHFYLIDVKRVEVRLMTMGFVKKNIDLESDDVKNILSS